jgi:hypothetical protein
MAVLAPADAAYAADSIYNLIDTSRLAAFGDKLNDKFAISSGRRLEGEAGAMFLKYRSGFALVAEGKSPGAFQGETLIAIRGTRDMLRDLLLTDGNIAIQRSIGGSCVHAGFNRTFDSFKGDLATYFRGRNPTRIHCVGHSLGGALATLTAEWVRAQGISQTSLYTFGSPRVGSNGFATGLTRQAHQDNIYRVHHRTDLVSMVPMWPFTHVPQPGIDCFIDSPGTIPFIAYHKMGKYVESCAGKGWRTLRQAKPGHGWEGDVREWLGSDGFIDLSVNTISMIGKALLFVLKKVAHAVGISIQGLLSMGLTLLDALAMMLAKAKTATREVAGYVTSLLRRMLQAMGRVRTVVVNATEQFIRFVLGAFMSAIYTQARRAIGAVFDSVR